MLKRGLKVVCTDDTIKPDHLMRISNDFPNWVKKGQEYTIRHLIVQVDENKNQQVISFLLEEIKNPPIWFEQLQMMHEPGFHISRFAVYRDTPPINQPVFAN